MSRSLAHYPFPDDACETLTRVISKLPGRERQAMTWRPTEDWLLEVSPDVAKYITDTFGDAGVRQLDPDWRPGAVLVPARVRAAVQGWFNETDSPAKWFLVEGIEFATARSRRAFEALL